jgi:NitT/TauT family transport system ATP-binding protein
MSAPTTDSPLAAPRAVGGDGASILQVRGLNRVFSSKGTRTVALQDVDLDVRPGEFLSLVGPSGCGKTTLLRIIDGLTERDSGQISFDGKPLTGTSADMAFVFQDISLLPWRSVRENVEIGLENRNFSKEERRFRALEALELVGLSDCADQPPYTLSGGMQQRVGVARALATRPKVLLMDEPFGQLDNFTRETLQVEMSKLWAKLHMTVLFVTHDVDEAIYLSDRVALFRRKPGRLASILTIDVPRPRWELNVRAHPRAIELREEIVDQLGVRGGDLG